MPRPSFTDAKFGHFPEGVAQFYEFSSAEAEGCLTGEFLGQTVTVLRKDAVITRGFPFVSITARFHCLREEGGKLRTMAIDTRPLELLATLTFAASARSREPDETSGLEEWDRYAFSAPDVDDPEWRFFKVEGIYTEHQLGNLDEHVESFAW